MGRGDMEGAASKVADDVVWREIGRAEPVRGKAALAASMGDIGGYDIKWETQTSRPATTMSSPSAPPLPARTASP